MAFVVPARAGTQLFGQAQGWIPASRRNDDYSNPSAKISSNVLGGKSAPWNTPSGV